MADAGCRDTEQKQMKVPHGGRRRRGSCRRSRRMGRARSGVVVASAVALALAVAGVAAAAAAVDGSRVVARGSQPGMRP